MDRNRHAVVHIGRPIGADGSRRPYGSHQDDRLVALHHKVQEIPGFLLRVRPMGHNHAVHIALRQHFVGPLGEFQPDLTFQVLAADYPESSGWAYTPPSPSKWQRSEATSYDFWLPAIIGYATPANAAPINGATQKSHSCAIAHPPTKRAGPVLRAGFTERFVMGIPTRWIDVSSSPIAIGAKP